MNPPKKSIYATSFEQHSLSKVAVMGRGFRDGIRKQMDYKPWEKR